MTFEHIEKYLAVEILMGIIKFPNVEDNWDKNSLLSNSISEIIIEILIKIYLFIYSSRSSRLFKR